MSVRVSCAALAGDLLFAAAVLRAVLADALPFAEAAPREAALFEVALREAVPFAEAVPGAAAPYSQSEEAAGAHFAGPEMNQRYLAAWAVHLSAGGCLRAEARPLAGEADLHRAAFSREGDPHS